MNENELSKIIVDAAIEVHKTLGGPGLLESIYRDALGIEIRRHGIDVEQEKQYLCHIKVKLFEIR